jgi:hypothetical protein
MQGVSSDEFPSVLFSTNPKLVNEVIDTLVSKRTRRLVTRDDLLGASSEPIGWRRRSAT